MRCSAQAGAAPRVLPKPMRRHREGSGECARWKWRAWGQHRWLAGCTPRCLQAVRRCFQALHTVAYWLYAVAYMLYTVACRLYTPWRWKWQAWGDGTQRVVEGAPPLRPGPRHHPRRRRTSEEDLALLSAMGIASAHAAMTVLRKQSFCKHSCCPDNPGEVQGSWSLKAICYLSQSAWRLRA